MSEHRKELYLIFDESGESGYSDDRKLSDHDFGVMAGFLVPEDEISEIRSQLRIITDQLNFSTKMHITDLPEAEQIKARELIFNHLKNRKDVIVYYAQYLDEHRDDLSFAGKIIKQASERVKNRRIKIGRSEKRELFEVQLFSGILLKASCFLKQHGYNHLFNLNMISDKTDKGLLKSYEKTACNFSKLANGTKQIITGYDSFTQRKVEAHAVIKVKEINTLLGGVSIQITCEDSPLTFAADVIANSIRFWLSSSIANKGRVNLERRESLDGHPMLEQIYGFFK